MQDANPRKSTKQRNTYDKKQAMQRMIYLLERMRRKRTGESPRPVPAILLARAAGVCPKSNRETKRRAIRQLVTDAKADGIAIVANVRGYWIADDAADHLAYENFLRKHAVHELASARQARAAAIADRQLAMH